MAELDTIVQYLEHAPAPVSRAKLLNELRSRWRWTVPDAEARLKDAIEAGQAFPWPKFRGAVRYWHRDPTGVVREELLTISADAALRQDDLIRATRLRAYNCGAEMAQSAIRGLVKEGQLRKERTIGPALYYRTDHPQTLVQASLAALRERFHQLGIDAGAVETRGETAGVSPADALFDQIVLLQPAPGIPVTIESLRAAIPGMSKAEFDSTVLGLADQGRLYLTTHDHGWALAEAERDKLVWDGGQKLYVAVTLRD